MKLFLSINSSAVGNPDTDDKTSFEEFVPESRLVGIDRGNYWIRANRKSNNERQAFAPEPARTDGKISFLEPRELWDTRLVVGHLLVKTRKDFRTINVQWNRQWCLFCPSGHTKNQ